MMTHKKLLNEIVTQNQENMKQISTAAREEMIHFYEKRDAELVENISLVCGETLKSSVESLKIVHTEMLSQLLESIQGFAEGITKEVSVFVENSSKNTKELQTSVVKLHGEVTTLEKTMGQLLKRGIEEINHSLVENLKENQEENNRLLKEQKEILAGIKKTNEDASTFNSKKMNEFTKKAQESFDKLEKAIDDFDEKQDDMIRDLQKKISRTLETGVDNLNDSLANALKENQEQMELIEQIVADNAKNFTDQTNLVKSVLETNQQLSSKDIQLLQNLMKGKNGNKR